MRHSKASKTSNAKDKHHRLCTSTGGKNVPENISIVPMKHHRAYHLLFNNLPPKEVARLLTEVWIDPAYYLVAVPRAKSKKRLIKTNEGDFLQITFLVEATRKVC